MESLDDFYIRLSELIRYAKLNDVLNNPHCLTEHEIFLFKLYAESFGRSDLKLESLGDNSEWMFYHKIYPNSNIIFCSEFAISLFAKEFNIDTFETKEILYSIYTKYFNFIGHSIYVLNNIINYGCS